MDAQRSYADYGVKPVINGRGCSTIIGGSLMSPSVVAAMVEGAKRFVRLDDLQRAGGEVVSRLTGSETGYLTSGAAAGVTLSTAAVLAGVDTERLNALPSTNGPNEVLMQALHKNPYDHMVRAAGARLKIAGTPSGCDEADLRRAASEEVVAAYFSASREYRGGVSAERFVSVAHELGLPIIVDTSMNLPPATNLRRFVDAGADLVCFSGGKAIRGPAASGFIACSQTYQVILTLIGQDLDVAPSTWQLRHLLGAHLTAVPDQGLGRGMKVGKEEMLALLVALTEYADRDHAAEYAAWNLLLEQLANQISPVAGVRLEISHVDGRPVPVLHLQLDSLVTGRTAIDVVSELGGARQPIIVDDHEAYRGLIRINPEGLTEGEVGIVAAALNRAFEPKAT